MASEQSCGLELVPTEIIQLPTAGCFSYKRSSLSSIFSLRKLEVFSFISEEFIYRFSWVFHSANNISIYIICTLWGILLLQFRKKIVNRKFTFPIIYTGIYITAFDYY